jgi:hypothetical protein
MSIKTVQITAEPLRSLAYTDISSSYAAVGSGLAYPSPLYAIQNQTDADITWSWDGVTDMGFLPANGGHIILDISTNRDDYQTQFVVGQGIVLYVVAYSTTPTLGSVYVTSLYAKRST